METALSCGLGIGGDDLQQVFRNADLAGNVEEFCAPLPAVDDGVLDELPCSARHTPCQICPYGDVYPSVQFPLPSGNIRKQKLLDIWNNSAQLNEVRSIHVGNLAVCSTCAHAGSCTRCPDLAYMEGNMRGRSTQDCDKSSGGTGILPANMLA